MSDSFPLVAGVRAAVPFTAVTRGQENIDLSRSAYFS
jgi:hypothetical protein